MTRCAVKGSLVPALAWVPVLWLARAPAVWLAWVPVLLLALRVTGASAHPSQFRELQWEGPSHRER